MLTSTSPLTAAFPEVCRRLEAWAGFGALSAALQDCPDLDVYLAGGVVRNSVLRAPHQDKDFDFFIDGPSTGTALGLFAQHGAMRTTPFGSARWHPATDPGCYADLIRIGEFRPGLWRCEDIVDVLNQFDFTASALAFDLRSGQAFDPQNGLRDLTRRTMRMIRFDYPDTPFNPGAALTMGPILWFRILHYARVLELTIEPLTLEWLRAHRSHERHADAFAGAFFEPCEGYLRPLG